MKKILILLFSFILLSTGFAYATDSEENKTQEEINSELYGTEKETNSEIEEEIEEEKKLENSEIKEKIQVDKYVTREEIFIELFSQLEVLKSYKYINLYYTDVKKGSALYTALQKGVYLDLFTNTTIKISPEKKMSQYHFMVIAENILDKDYGTNSELKKLE